MDMGVLGCVMEDMVEADFVHLRHRADVPRDGLVGGDLPLAAQDPQMPGLEWLSAVADIQQGVGCHAPLVDAEYRDTSDEGINLYLEDVGENVPARVRNCDYFLCRPVRGGAEVDGRVALGGVGQEFHDHIDQLRDTGAAPGRGEYHRNQAAVPQGALKRLMQLFRGDLALI